MGLFSIALTMLVLGMHNRRLQDKGTRIRNDYFHAHGYDIEAQSCVEELVMLDKRRALIEAYGYTPGSTELAVAMRDKSEVSRRKLEQDLCIKRGIKYFNRYNLPEDYKRTIEEAKKIESKHWL